ncbi:hypothetical protein GZ126_12135 [Staphylococcus aureus]|nr:hypothetical protein [Staphylococcus aureus]
MTRVVGENGELSPVSVVAAKGYVVVQHMLLEVDVDLFLLVRCPSKTTP